MHDLPVKPKKVMPKSPGRPKGGKNHRTIYKENAARIASEMILKELEPMINAQIAHAKGIDHFFLRDPRTKEFVQVTEPSTIQAALNKGEKDSYYWIRTKDPNVQAFTDLMNRALGKPIDSIEVAGKSGGPIKVKWIGEKS